jgi:hypothetical protein
MNHPHRRIGVHAQTIRNTFEREYYRETIDNHPVVAGHAAGPARTSGNAYRILIPDLAFRILTFPGLSEKSANN